MQHVEGLWDRRREGAPTERPFRARGTRPARRPNLVFVLADDLGWGDLGCYGSLHIHTPHLDRLAAGGVRFTHAYSASPWCSPTRIALYTGLNPGRLVAGLEEPLRTRDEEHGIPPDRPTLPGLLRDAGYRTAMFGKWHCGWLPWYSPLKAGFETFWGNLDGAVDYFTHIGTLGEPDLYDGEEPTTADGYYTDLITDRAVDYVRAADPATPFYLQLNYNAPHWPWEGRGDRDVADAILEQYRGGRAPFPLLHLDGGSLAKYGELVEAMDDGIGRLLDALDETGRADDTLIVFCSDNGGERYSYSWPFVGEKGDVTEGGIRVPFLLRWPAAVDGGQWSDGTHITYDWTATFLDVAGTGPAPDHPIDGVSLLPWLVDGADHPGHDLFWRIASQGALRRGTWKYLVDGRDRAVLGSWPRRPGVTHHLYDLSGDGREHADRARAEPPVLAELRAAWEAIEATLLPYPPDHPNLPRQAAPGRPAVSRAD